MPVPATYNSALSRLASRILGEALRPLLRRRVAREPSVLDELEAWLLAQHVERTPLDTSRWPQLQGLLAKGQQRLAPEEFRRLVERVHRRALKGAAQPAWRTYTYRGFKVTHDIRHTAQWNAFIQRKHQPGVGYWLRHYARAASTILDVGANVGIFSLEMAAELGPGGRIYAFEPNPEVFALLEQAVGDNALAGKVVPVPCALGATEAVLPLSIPTKNVGAGTLEPGAGDHYRVEVKVASFRGWWEDSGRPRIDLIKIDVEGHEAAVLEGMWDYLEEHKPVVVMEVAPATARGRELVQRLMGIGYEVRRVVPEFPHASETLTSDKRQIDILCTVERPAAEAHEARRG